MPSQQVKKACVKEYLKYIRSLSVRIEMLQEEIERKRSLLEMTAHQFSDKVTSSIQDSRIAESLSDLKDLIHDFAKELSVYIEQQRLAYAAFSKLSSVEGTRAMVAYYLEKKPWEEICVEMNYSWDGIMSLRRRCANELYEFLPSEWKTKTRASDEESHLNMHTQTHMKS